MMWHMDVLELLDGVKVPLAIWEEEFDELLVQIHPDIEEE
jgi:hypothetical protein